MKWPSLSTTVNRYLKRSVVAMFVLMLVENTCLSPYYYVLRSNTSVAVEQKLISLNISCTATKRAMIMSGEPSVVVPLRNDTQPDFFAQLQARNLAIRKANEPLRVHLFPRGPGGRWITGELKHFAYDGITRSPFLNLSTQPFHNASDLWIAHVRLGYAPRKWCANLENLLQTVYKGVPKKLRTPIIVMDWRDTPGEVFTCFKFMHVLGADKHVYTKRSVVVGRNYNNETLTLGRIESGWPEISGASIRHTPYAVRSDFVQALEQVLSVPSLVQSNVVERHRPNDAVHFWPLNSSLVDRGGRVYNSHLRDAVSRLLLDLQTTDGLLTFAGLAGIPNEVGRNSVDLDYARAILEYKIVVVAQKDLHEDHYRLMEALASGALVMSDVMLSLPRDFCDGESIVFYSSMHDLRTKIKYYLENDEARLRIARQGWMLAMHRHRSWHLVEELIFGKILSPAIP